MFEPAVHGNKPFGMRIPALVVSRGKQGQINFLTAMWFSIQKRHKDSLRLMCLIKQSSVHGYSSDAESIVPTNCQEIVLAVVQLEIILRSLGGGIVLGDDMAQRSVVKNHGSRGN
jgi:hypothetical protein